jgi:hypothetical protein
MGEAERAAMTVKGLSGQDVAAGGGVDEVVVLTW